MDEEEFRGLFEDKLKLFIKEELKNLPRNNIFEFDIKKFIEKFPEACEINDIIIKKPKFAEDIIYSIFKETYIEIYGEDEKIEKIQIAFKNPMGCYKVIEDISAEDVNRLVKFEGNIIKAGKVCALLKKACFVCPKCGNIKYINIHNYFELPEPICNREKDGEICREKMILDYDESTYINIQELEIQQPIDLMKNPDDPPRSIKVFLENSKGIYSGRVEVIGTVLRKKTRKNLPVFEIFVRSNYINLSESYQRIEVRDIINNPEIIEILDELGRKKNIIDILSNYLIYQIKGYEIVKKAIFLQQIKGAFKFLPDGTPLRRDSHILLITDPGIGKTTMLKRISRLFPQNAYASVTTATGGGLTAIVTRESTEISDGWVVKPGVFVKANEGTACIDELTVDKDVMKYILEAMESQTIHISKGGLNVKLPARCAVLAACNPKRGRFDRNLTVIEQIDIPAPLLSRFDLIFPLKDIPNRETDKEIAEYILKAHYESAKKDYQILAPIEVDGIVVDEKILKYYIIYARNCAYIEENRALYLDNEFSEVKLKMPYLTNEAMKLIENYYLEMRKLGEGDNPIPITARQLEAIIRISEMHAKARLSEKVEKKDAEEAIKIIDYCLKEIAYDPESGTLDLDKITGTPKSRRDKMDLLLDIIKEIIDERGDNLAPEAEIYERAKAKGMDEKDIERTLEYLRKSGDIFTPRYGFYSILE
ncbi:MCM family protein [Methanocaldococcus infernus ME]|uniref:MCM family protein n=1 Tax=Methanocaldococcus infernus (strain DSM 11812 / JCM 15783 / ME) TaxID=573063 RepID=D5VT05_METIM|nr:minichromosome maintenance protein MCM [Methanocaldococcus infernus]ADG13708.1 MCM family protein [Methanocaldococcus infernus ME]